MKSRFTRRRGLLIALLAFPLFGASAGANLLLNPGFESGPGGGAAPDDWWTYTECGQHSWAARSGSQGVAFHSYVEGSWGGFGQDVPATVQVGELITFSIWAQAEGSYTSENHEAWIKMKLFTNGSATVAAEYLLDVYDGLVNQRGSWNEYRLVVTNPLAGVDQINMTIGGGGFKSGEGSRSVLWDDADLSITPVALGENLQRSPGFEDGQNWVRNGEMGYESWAARDSGQGLAMYGWRTGGFIYQDVLSSGEKAYTFSIYGLKDAAFSLSALKTELKLEFFSDLGVTRIGEVTTVVQQADAAWTLYSVSGVSPENTALVRVTLAFDGTASDDSFKWDDAGLVARSAPAGLHLDSSVDDPADMDGDGLDDVAELRAGNLDPLDPDCDRDGIRDGDDPRPTNPNEAPEILQVSLVSVSNRHNDGAVTLAIFCTDPDGDAVEYRYAANGGTASPWQSVDTPFVWQPPTNSFGPQTLTVTAKDSQGVEDTESASIYLFRTPPRP
ncbi:MAG: hypothetical protein PHG65_02920 [Kiritimatiellae bacterium]|nr:hypothetical protein [Kiritimatiellia bacterium]